MPRPPHSLLVARLAVLQGAGINLGSRPSCADSRNLAWLPLRASGPGTNSGPMSARLGTLPEATNEAGISLMGREIEKTASSGGLRTSPIPYMARGFPKAWGKEL